MPHIVNGHPCSICRWWFFKADIQDRLPILKGGFKNEVWGICKNTSNDTESMRNEKANDPNTHHYQDKTLYTTSALACGYGEYRSEFLGQPRECEWCNRKLPEDELLSICLCHDCDITRPKETQ